MSAAAAASTGSSSGSSSAPAIAHQTSSGRPPLATTTASLPTSSSSSSAHTSPTNGAATARSSAAGTQRVSGASNVYLNPLSSSSSATSAGHTLPPPAVRPFFQALPPLTVSVRGESDGLRDVVKQLVGVPFASVLARLPLTDVSEEDVLTLQGAIAPNVLRRSLRTTVLVAVTSVLSGLWAALVAPTIIRAVSG